MMKYLITPENGASLYAGSLDLEDLQHAVDGYIELVYFQNAIMIVNEEGLIKQLPFNTVASSMAYRTIVGNAVLLTGLDYEAFIKEETTA